MTDRELMQQALDALEDVGGEWGFTSQRTLPKRMNVIEALRARLAQPEQTPTNNGRYLTGYKAQPEPEPVAWVAYENGEKHGIDFDEDEIAKLPVGTMLYPIPPHFIDPAKVARLIDEAFERGKKEIDMEQVKDIAQKLADCALLNSAPPQPKQEPVAWMHDSYVGFNVPLYTAPPQRKWQGLTDDEILEEYRQSYGDDGNLTDVYFARAIEFKLKEKNNA